MKTDNKVESSAVHPVDREGLRTLSRQLLRYANGGVSKVDFIQKTARLVLGFSGSDSIQVWFRDQEGYLCCAADADGGLSFLTETDRLPGRGGRSLSVSVLTSEIGSPSVLVAPILSGRRQVGLLLLRSEREGYFCPDTAKFYEELVGSLGLAFVHVQTQAKLQERVKELTCLYSIARIAARPDTWLEDVFHEVVNILPAAWLYPEIAGARILFRASPTRVPTTARSRTPSGPTSLSTEGGRGSLRLPTSRRDPVSMRDHF